MASTQGIALIAPVQDQVNSVIRFDPHDAKRIAPPAYSLGHSTTEKQDVSGGVGTDTRQSFVTDERYFRNGNQPRESDVFIALMGVTGAGKSTFISHCTDMAVKVGHTLQGCTLSTYDVNLQFKYHSGFI